MDRFSPIEQPSRRRFLQTLGLGLAAPFLPSSLAIPSTKTIIDVNRGGGFDRYRDGRMPEPMWGPIHLFPKSMRTADTGMIWVTTDVVWRKENGIVHTRQGPVVWRFDGHVWRPI